MNPRTVISDFRSTLPMATTLLLVAMTGFVRADDDVVVDAVAAPVAGGITVQQFEQWIFGGGQNAATGRKQIESRLSLQLEELEKRCRLTNDQKEKLELAARGDIKRFFERVDGSRKKFQAVGNDANRINEIWPDIEPLQQKLHVGLFDDQSLFAKTLEKTLDEEQAASYRAVQLERRKFRYKAAIGAALLKLDVAVPLRDEERRKLLDVLLEETPPPEQFGPFDYHYVMYRLATLPDGKLNGLFDDVQRKMLARELAQAKAMRQTLIQQKVLANLQGKNPDGRRSAQALIPKRSAPRGDTGGER